MEHEWCVIDDIKLLLLHEEHGSRWSLIANQLGCHSDNKTKNRFYSMARKEIKELWIDRPHSLPSQLIISYYFRKLFLSKLLCNQCKVDYLKTMLAFGQINAHSIREKIECVEKAFAALKTKGWKSIATEFVGNYNIASSLEFPARLLPIFHTLSCSSCSANDRAHFALAWLSSAI